MNESVFNLMFFLFEVVQLFFSLFQLLNSFLSFNLKFVYILSKFALSFVSFLTPFRVFALYSI